MLQDPKLREGSGENLARLLMEAGPIFYHASQVLLPWGWTQTQGKNLLCDLTHPKCKIKCCGEGGKPGLFIKANTIKHMLKITECFDPCKHLDHSENLFSFSEGTGSRCFPGQKPQL